jgi:sn-glycerol 3-phosphate transport system substrate-binding protein
MSMRRNLRSSVPAVALAIALSSCGGSGSTNHGSATTPGGGTQSLPACPLAALRTAKKPVNITYWHAMTRANEDELKKLTDQFNAQQHDVHVTLSASASYTDNTTRFKAGLSTGALPDLMQGEDASLQTLIDSQSVLPAASCLRADNATTADLIPRVVAYYSVNDVLYPMPFNDSNPILYYNKAVFRRAGLDPDKPPLTFAELEADSRKIVQSGAAHYGIALKTDSWLVEHWLAKSGDTIVNNDNGRRARATRVTFDNATGIAVFTALDEMVKSKVALSTGSGDNNLDHYLAVGKGEAAMTIDTSAALGTIAQLFSAGQFKNVQLGVGPMPGPDSPNGSVLVGGAANYIIKHSAPEKQAAAYEFAKYLAGAQTQSEWAAATGYVPVSKSAASRSPLAEKYRRQPEYRVAYDQLLAGPVNPATAGPVIGAYGSTNEGVRGAIVDGLSRMLDGRLTPEQAAAAAAAQANAAIDDYNRRIG